MVENFENPLELVDESLRPEVSRIFFKAEKSKVHPEKIIKNLVESVLKEKIKKIQLEIKAAERDGNTEKIIELMREKQNLIKKVRGKNG